MRQETSVAMARSRVYISIVIGFVIFLAVFFVMSDKAEKGTWQQWGFPLISAGIGVWRGRVRGRVRWRVCGGLV